MRSPMHKLSNTAAFRFTQSCHKIPHKSNPTTMRLGKFPLLVLPATTGQPLTSVCFHPRHRIISKVQIGTYPVDGVCWSFSSVYLYISGDLAVPPVSDCLGGITNVLFIIDRLSSAIQGASPPSRTRMFWTLRCCHNFLQFPKCYFPRRGGATSRLARTRSRWSSGSSLCSLTQVVVSHAPHDAFLALRCELVTPCT